MTQVYRIDKMNTHGNEYGINRDETWSLARDRMFSSFEEAKDYVIAQNRKFCGYELGVLYCDDCDIIAHRCTHSNFCHKQKYFLEKPNMQLMREYLELDGVTTFITQ